MAQKIMLKDLSRNSPLLLVGVEHDLSTVVKSLAAVSQTRHTPTLGPSNVLQTH